MRAFSDDIIVDFLDTITTIARYSINLSDNILLAIALKRATIIVV